MNHYYTIKDANKIGDQPVKMIMKTVDYYYVAGVYETHENIYIKLSHISRWDYDMLDAFGVEAIVTERFEGNYSNVARIHSWKYKGQ